MAQIIFAKRVKANKHSGAGVEYIERSHEGTWLEADRLGWIARPAPTKRRVYVAKCQRDGNKRSGYARAAFYEVTE